MRTTGDQGWPSGEPALDLARSLFTLTSHRGSCGGPSRRPFNHAGLVALESPHTALVKACPGVAVFSDAKLVDEETRRVRGSDHTQWGKGQTAKLWPIIVWVGHVAGPKPTTQVELDLIRMDQGTTIVLRIQLTTHGNGHWLPPAPTVKDFRQLLRAMDGRATYGKQR
eukprot:6469087-Amphidinium_carterae.8